MNAERFPSLEALGYVMLDEDNNVVPATDCVDTLEEWGEWWNDPENRSIDATVVALEDEDDLVVRTAFFGRDFADGMSEEPQYFGTMVFQSGQPVEWFEERFYATYEEATAGHVQTANDVRKEVWGDDDE